MNNPVKATSERTHFVRVPPPRDRGNQQLHIRYKPTDPRFAQVEELLASAPWGSLNSLLLHALTIGAPVVLQEIRDKQQGQRPTATPRTTRDPPSASTPVAEQGSREPSTVLSSATETPPPGNLVATDTRRGGTGALVSALIGRSPPR